MVHIKDPLLLTEKCSPCGSSKFPILLSEWSFTTCLALLNVLSALLNKTFLSFLFYLFSHKNISNANITVNNNV